MKLLSARLVSALAAALLIVKSTSETIGETLKDKIVAKVESQTEAKNEATVEGIFKTCAEMNLCQVDGPTDCCNDAGSSCSIGASNTWCSKCGCSSKNKASSTVLKSSDTGFCSGLCEVPNDSYCCRVGFSSRCSSQSINGRTRVCTYCQCPGSYPYSANAPSSSSRLAYPLVLAFASLYAIYKS